DPFPASARTDCLPRPAGPPPAFPAGHGACGCGGTVAAALAGALGRRRARRGGRLPPRARSSQLMSRRLRITATLLVSSLAVAYIVYKINLHQTVEILRSASVPWVVLSAILTLITVPPMAWRWQRLLAARGVHDSVGWLTRAYFVSYAWGQILPTLVGGDASRIYETARRHPGQITPITGSVLVERALGGAVTLVLSGIGFL